MLALSGLLGAVALTGATAGTASAADELPVYAVRSEGLTPEQATTLQQAFGLGSVEHTPEGVVTFIDEDRHLRVPGIDRGAGRPDESGQATSQTQLDLDAVRGLRAVPLDEAAKRVTETLRGVGLLPGNATASASHSTLDITDANGNALAGAPLDTTVTFDFQLDGLPLEGPGSKIRVSLDGAGAVTQLTYSTRVLARAGTVQVLGYDERYRRCRAAAYPLQLGLADYIYWAPPWVARPPVYDRLEPVLRCRVLDPSTGSSSVFHLPGVLGSPAPTPDPVVPPRRDSATDANAGVGAQWTTRVDVGSSGTGTCQSLSGVPADVTGFNTRFTGAGVP
ncbi:hypothetical protein CKY47_34355, partial [Saccharothrix yanglingensis]|nr:hypothetical protein [Saccharothrix yanglingensis]